MKRTAVVLLLATAVGATACATHWVPPRIISVDWGTVRALALGTRVAVYLSEKDVRYGRLETVTEQTLALREEFGLSALPRSSIARVAVRETTGTTRAPQIVKGAAIGAAISGALAYLTYSTIENPSPSAAPAGWAVFLGGTAAGATLGAIGAPQEKYRERLVYIRP